jgi:hypothetical protein
MSNRKKPEEPKPYKPTMTGIPSVYVDQYEYVPDGALIHFRFGRAGRTDVAVTMTLNLFLDAANKVQAQVVANLPKPPEEPKP